VNSVSREDRTSSNERGISERKIINGYEVNSKNKNTRNFHGGINEFKKGHEPELI
jgi:hypothetical protein